MPSFLSKVFGRKKDERDPPRTEGRVSDATLLESGFEALSPSTTKFPEAPNGKRHMKEKDKEAGFGVFRVRSRQPPPHVPELVNVPQLSLRLPSQREGFETESDDQNSLTDSVIGDRRLNPVETLTLIRACSQAITARGLETLGIMHPDWYSASPDVQRRLISLFIQSLAPKSPLSTLAPTASPFISAFESEISSARSPHDVAAVLRWGIRHLRLEGNAFGKDDAWYKNFFDAERSSEYPPAAFSTQLAPQLPKPHLELLVATLEILSLLAAHAEANGISGSKLSKFFGLWLLTAHRAEDRDDWSSFYARWERMGRILEHIFLSRIRDEAVSSRMPTRLLELVHQYPYTKTATPSPEADLFSRPRFSTRQYDALFIRIETEISASSDEPRPHPLRLLSDAFNAETSSSDNSDHAELWGSIKKAVANQTNPSPGGYPALSHIFADETIRFLSLLPMEDSNKEPLLPPFNLLIPKKPTANGKRSVSDPIASPSSPSTSRHTKPVTDPAPSTLPSVATSLSVSSTDWTEFSTSGFFETSTAVAPLASTLITDKDVMLSPSMIKRSRLRPITPLSVNVNGRKSSDGSWMTPGITKEGGTQPEKSTSRATLLSLIQLDEAFIDFWADALPDPISADWPAFVICKLNEGVNGLDLTVDGGRRINWLVVEQAFKRPVVVPANTDGAAGDVGGSRRPRPASPKASVRSEATLHSMKKRFSFWSAGGRASVDNGLGAGKGKGKKTGGQNVGEMGEMLREEDEKEATVKLGIPFLKAKSSTSFEVKRKSVDATPKSVEVPKASGDSKANANGVARLGVPSLAAVTGAAAVVEVASKAAEPAGPESPSNSAPPARSTEVVSPVPVVTYQAESAPAPQLEETVPSPAKIVVSKKSSKPAVDPIPAPPPEQKPRLVPIEILTTQVQTSAPSVVERVPSADIAQVEIVPVTQDATVAPAVESEPTVEGHAPEEPERTIVPEVVVHPAPATLAEETETDVTINVETVEAVPFSDTASITPPATARAEPAVVAHTPEPVEVLGHTEPFHVHQRGAEDHGVDQNAVPIVGVDAPPVGQPTVEETLEVPPREPEPSVLPEVIKASHSVNAVEPVETQEELPPAPESVVLSGETPGPVVALSTSEPVTIAHVTTAEVEEEDETQPADPKSNGSAEPILESLSSVSNVSIAADPDVQHGAIASPNH